MTNNGPGPATNIDLTDVLPVGVTLVSATLSIPGAGIVDTTGAPVIDWTINALAATETVSLMITVSVDMDGHPGPDGASYLVDPITNTASVVSTTETDHDASNDSDSADIDVREADLSVVKTVDDGTPQELDLITYTITVTNNGTGKATNVLVTDGLPASLTYDSDDAGVAPDSGISYNPATGEWTVGTLLAGESATINITVQVAAGASFEVDPISNTATAISDIDDDVPGNNSDTANIDVREIDLELTKSVDDLVPAEGQVIAYTIVVSNVSTADATGVEVEDVLPAGLTYVSDDGGTQGAVGVVGQTVTWTVGAIGAGGSATLVVMVSVDGGTAGTIIDNEAEVSAADQDDVDSDPSNLPSGEDDEDLASIEVAEIDLELTKTVSDNNPSIGDTVTYTLTLSNTGPLTATNQTVTDILPAGVTFAGFTVTGASVVVTGGLPTIVWTVLNLAPGASVTLDIDVTIDAGTAAMLLTNEAEVTAQAQLDHDSVPANGPSGEDDEATVDLTVQGIDLELAKAVSDTLPLEGQTITYTLTLTNTGPNDATGVEVTDDLPAGVTYVSDDGGAATAEAAGTVTWTIASLASGASVALTITVTVDAATAGATLTNEAYVTAADQEDLDSTPGAPAGEDDEATAPLTVADLDLVIDKTGSTASPLVAGAVVYTITVTNNGPGDATGIVITDVIPAGATYVSDDGGSQGGVVFADPLVTWTVGALLSGASATLTITVTADGPVGVTVTNTADISVLTEVDGDATNDSDDASFTPVAPGGGGGGGGGFPPPPVVVEPVADEPISDLDGDGIEDLIDLEPDVFSDEFDDGDGTTGTVLLRDDIVVTVVDNPDNGVIITASGPGSALVEINGSIFLLTDGDEIDVGVGSVIVTVVTGPVSVDAIAGVTVDVTAGATLTIDDNGDGTVTLTHEAGSTGVVTVTVEGESAVVLAVGASDTFGVAAETEPVAEEPLESVSTNLSRGVNLIGWISAPTTSTALLAADPAIVTIWVLRAGVWIGDSEELPEALRQVIAIAPGDGLFIITTNSTVLESDAALEPGSLPSLIRGLNLLGWLGGPTTSAELIAANPDIDTIWALVNGVWTLDSSRLPAALRPTIVIDAGTGFLIGAVRTSVVGVPV